MSFDRTAITDAAIDAFVADMSTAYGAAFVEATCRANGRPLMKAVVDAVCDALEAEGVGGLQVYKVGDEYRPSNTTLANDGDLNLTGVPAGHYKFELFVPYLSGSVSMSCRVTVANGSMISSHSGGLGGTAVQDGDVLTLSPGATKILHLKGSLDMSSTGSVHFQWAQDTSAVDPTIVLGHAWMKLTPF